ncbi:hypothetical protein GF359_01730 [candidate division WOR-3 bacterium]|uniref:Uncharacterized protein n=1 Tax=candidate division WOR-3 bacterium TaxID=2052148 RepID=A0A9D5QBX2_UNCW3|nr:hypothetical protein [candidate division WOR-3 bacterium]MBD3363914.1 hypothetical protein [candidate division WOR-3 bacterium]
MNEIVIEIETKDSDLIVGNLMGEKNPPRGAVYMINEDTNLRYEGTLIRKAIDVPSLCYFFLGFIAQSLASGMVVHGANWILDKLAELTDKITLRINGRKTEITKEAITEAIETASSEPSIEDQIQNIVSEVEQFSETIVPLAHERRLHTEEFHKDDPCARLSGAFQFYSTIIESIKPKLEELIRLKHLCMGPIPVSEQKEPNERN